jgi:hypothetical protein
MAIGAALWACILIFTGCCINVIALELIALGPRTTVGLERLLDDRR